MIAIQHGTVITNVGTLAMWIKKDGKMDSYINPLFIHKNRTLFNKRVLL